MECLRAFLPGLTILPATMPPRSQQVQAAGQPAAAAGNGQQQQRNEPSWTGTIVKCAMMFFFLKQFFGGGARKPQPNVQNRHEMYLPKFNRSEPMVSLFCWLAATLQVRLCKHCLLCDAGVLILPLRSAFVCQHLSPVGRGQAALTGHALLLGSTSVLLLPSLPSSPSVTLALQDFALYLSESSSWADGELIWSKQAVPLATGPELTTSYLYKPSKVVTPSALAIWPDVRQAESINSM